MNLIKFPIVMGVFVGLLMPKPVMAQYNQANNNLSIVIDKKVSDVTNPVYFDNISASTKVFREGDKIDFKIIIENTSNTRLDNLKLTDYLPKYLQVINGFATVNNNEMTIIIDTLDVGQTKTYNILATINDTPIENGINQKWQITNKACVASVQVSDCDKSSYFVGGKVMPVTGSEDIIWQSMIALMTIGTAIGAKKYIRGY